MSNKEIITIWGLVIVFIGPLVILLIRQIVNNVRIAGSKYDLRDWYREEMPKRNKLALDYMSSNGFTVSKSIPYILYVYGEDFKVLEVFLDTQGCRLLVANYVKDTYTIVPFANILSYEVKSNLHTKTEGYMSGGVYNGSGSMSGRLDTRAVLTHMDIHIKTKIIGDSLITLSLIPMEVSIYTATYKRAVNFTSEVESLLQSILHYNQEQGK